VGTLGSRAFDLLIEYGVDLDKGLSPREIWRIQEQFGFVFNEDHRELLSLGLPRGRGWPDWRHASSQDLESRLAGPADGTLFDVEHDAFWPSSWPPRPGELPAALDVARAHLDRWPKLVPVYLHRYLPADPWPSGSPVFSVHQTDVIFYGNDLTDYVNREFGHDRSPIESKEGRPYVPVWSDLAAGAESDAL
jgi:hypothetical protein